LDYRLLILALGTFSIGTDSYVVAGILPQVGKSFSTSVAAAAQFVSVYSVSYAVFTPVMATLVANWPRRRVLLLGLLAFAASNVLTATAPTFELALAGRALAGFGGAIFVPAASAVATALVPAERRGRALAIVLAGVSGATALGAPIGTVIASLGDWHTTLWFVAILGSFAAAGVLLWLPNMPATSVVTLQQRLAPIWDLRVAATLATTFLVMSGVFLVYTYLSVVFDRATQGNGPLLALLMSIWGIGATTGSLKAGSLIDRFGNRRTFNIAATVLLIDFLLLPWTSVSFASAAVALAIWGMCGWGLVVAQQHRLVALNQALAPLLLALNASAIYLAIGASGATGALLLRSLSAHYLPLIGATLIAAGCLMGETAYHVIRSVRPWQTAAIPERRE